MRLRFASESRLDQLALVQAIEAAARGRSMLRESDRAFLKARGYEAYLKNLPERRGGLDPEGAVRTTARTAGNRRHGPPASRPLRIAPPRYPAGTTVTVYVTSSLKVMPSSFRALTYPPNSIVWVPTESGFSMA